MKIVSTRPMTREDVPRVYELEEECFQDPWSLDSLYDECDREIAHYRVVEYDEQVVGYAGMWILYDEAHINNVAVSSKVRRMGFGEFLMYDMMSEALRNGADVMTLEVREHNLPAQGLYEKIGFVHRGTRKRYYSNGEDAFIMWNDDLSQHSKGDRLYLEEKDISSILSQYGIEFRCENALYITNIQSEDFTFIRLKVTLDSGKSYVISISQSDEYDEDVVKNTIHFCYIMRENGIEILKFLFNKNGKVYSNFNDKLICSVNEFDLNKRGKNFKLTQSDIKNLAALLAKTHIISEKNELKIGDRTAESVFEKGDIVSNFIIYLDSAIDTGNARGSDRRQIKKIKEKANEIYNSLYKIASRAKEYAVHGDVLDIGSNDIARDDIFANNVINEALSVCSKYDGDKEENIVDEFIGAYDELRALNEQERAFIDIIMPITKIFLNGIHIQLVSEDKNKISDAVSKISSIIEI